MDYYQMEHFSQKVILALSKSEQFKEIINYSSSDINPYTSTENTDIYNLLHSYLNGNDTLENVTKLISRISIFNHDRDDVIDILYKLIEAVHKSISYGVKVNICGKIMNINDKIALKLHMQKASFFRNDWSAIIDKYYNGLISSIKCTATKKSQYSHF